MAATILGNLGTEDLTVLGGPVTISTGLTVTTLPNVSPVVIDVTGIDVDSYWHLDSGKITPENLLYKVGLGAVDAGNTTTDYFLLLNSTTNEVKKVIGSTMCLASHTQAWSTLTATPTTLAGYGITDAAALVHTHSYQTLDADLTAIAALSVNGFLKKTAGTWGMDTNSYEVALGNPAGNGYILSSDTNGARSWIANNHTGVYEPVLGNPGVDGYVLSSDMAGNRSWVAQAGGGGSGMAIHANEYHSTLDNTALSGTLTWGGVQLTTTFTKLNYLTSATGTTGTNTTNIVFSTSPALTTPNIGAATGTSLTVTGDVIAYSA